MHLKALINNLNKPYKDTNGQSLAIAEIGNNHNGDLDIAKKLIDVSEESGADAVKFVKRTIDIVYDEEMLDGHRESPWGTTQIKKRRFRI